MNGSLSLWPDGWNKREGVSNVTFFVWRHRRVRWTQAERNWFSKKGQSIRPSLSESDLFLRGDVQVLEARIEQEVLVDLVSRDVARRPSVHLGLGRQMNLQHLRQQGKCIRVHLNLTHPNSAVINKFCWWQKMKMKRSVCWWVGVCICVGHNL